jgi:hypothetical protein
LQFIAPGSSVPLSRLGGVAKNRITNKKLVKSGSVDLSGVEAPLHDPGFFTALTVSGRLLRLNNKRILAGSHSHKKGASGSQ